MTTGTSLPKEYLPLGWVFLYKIKRIIRVLDRYKAEVYNLEAITSLAFRIESFGAAKVLRALLERIIHGRKEKTTVFVSVVSMASPTAVGKHDDISAYQHINMQTYHYGDIYCRFYSSFQRKAEQIISVYKGKASTGLYVG